MQTSNGGFDLLMLIDDQIKDQGDDDDQLGMQSSMTVIASQIMLFSAPSLVYSFAFCQFS